MKCRGNGVCAEPTHFLSTRIHHSDFLDGVPGPSNFGEEVHPRRNLETCSPEVDHVAGCAQVRRTLDQCRCESVPQKPIRESRAGDSGPRYEDPHAYMNSTRAPPPDAVITRRAPPTRSAVGRIRSDCISDAADGLGRVANLAKILRVCFLSSRRQPLLWSEPRPLWPTSVRALRPV